MKEFMENATSFTKNPLGIIALFISLIYGIAALVLTTGTELNSNQKWPIIFFIVIFPLLVLIAFYRLVIDHHIKLYGPSDFKDEGNFIKITSENQSKKVKVEIEEVIDEDDKGRSLESSKDIYSKINVTPQFTQSIKMQYFLAEDLAFRQLEQDLNLTIQRHMAYKLDNRLIEVDGVSKSGNTIYGFEIKYNKKGYLSRNVILALSETAYSLNSTTLKNFKLVYALVYEEKEISNIEDLRTKLEELRIPFEIKQYDINKLKKNFGLH